MGIDWAAAESDEPARGCWDAFQIMTPITGVDLLHFPDRPHNSAQPALYPTHRLVKMPPKAKVVAKSSGEKVRASS